MSNRLIPDALVEQALETLRDKCEASAAARAIRLRAEFRRKATRAKLILEAVEKTADQRAAWAESHAEYAAACDLEVQATENDELLRAQRNDANTIIEAWRTEQASNRAGGSFR